MPSGPILAPVVAKLSVGMLCISNDEESVPPGLVAWARGTPRASLNGHFGWSVASGAVMALKSSYQLSGTVAPVIALGLPSRLIIITIFPCSSGCFFSQACDPTRPCSSAAKAMNTIERFGFAPAAAMRRIASIPGAKPDPSSTPPVPPVNASKWPPMTMYSSGYVVPRSVATTLWYFTGPMVNQLRMSNSRTTGSPFSTRALISLNCVLSSLMSGSTGSVSQDATKPSRMLSGGSELRSGWIGDGGVADWIVPSAPAATSAFVRAGIISASRYSGDPSASFEPRRPSRAKPLLAPGIRTQAPLKAALLALTSAIAAWTAARFLSTFSFGAGWPPCARPGTENGSAFRMTTGPR